MLRIVTMKYPCKISFEHYIHESVMYTGEIFSFEEINESMNSMNMPSTQIEIHAHSREEKNERNKRPRPISIGHRR
jgi:hypothetical protein